MVVLSVGGYLEANKGIVTGNFEAVGKEIARVADKGEVIFLRSPYHFIFPQWVLYAHRNIVRWQNDQATLKFLKKTGAPRGVIMVFNDQGQLVREKHLNVGEGEA